MPEHETSWYSPPNPSQWQMVYDQSPVGIGFLNHAGKWLKANRALCSLVEYVEYELVSKDFHDISHPDDVGPDADMRQRLNHGEIPGYEIHKRLITKTNKIVWTKQTISPVKDETGGTTCLVVHVQPLFNEGARIEKESNGRLNLRPTLTISDFITDNWKAVLVFGTSVASTLVMIGVAFWGMVEKVNLLGDQTAQQQSLLMEIIKDDINITPKSRLQPDQQSGKE